VESNVDELVKAMADTRNLTPRASAAIDSLVSLSREVALIAEREQPKKKRGKGVDLAESVRILIESRQKQLATSRRDVRCAIRGPVRVACDWFEVELMLLELLTNALKYGSDPIVVSVSESNRRAKFTVSDSGNGVAPAQRRQIFKKFARGAPHSQKEGYGIGLWLVRRIARTHNGDAHLRSVAGRAATFEVSLPLLSARR